MNVHVADWDESIASLFPLDLSGKIVALRVCMDASNASGVFTVAGIAFGYEQAVRANEKWKRLMKGRTFHMTDLNARKDAFCGIDNDEKSEIVKGIVKILKQHASFMVAISCDVSQISEPFPSNASSDRNSEEMRNAFRSAYGVMCHLCMSGLGGILEDKRSSPGKSLAYVLESGDAGQRGLTRFIEYILDQPSAHQLTKLYGMSRYTVSSKEEMEGIFHAADFLAWEWSRHVQRHQSGQPMRKSLSELTGTTKADSDYFGVTLSRKGKYMLRNLDNRHMERFVRYTRGVIEAVSQDEVDAAAREWEKTRFTDDDIRMFLASRPAA
jgi:hypothetical protein